MKKIRCGDANPNGNIAIFFKGGCQKELDIEEAYRCTGCGGYFHLDCIHEHFVLEEDHDVARNALKKIKDVIVLNWLRDKGMQNIEVMDVKKVIDLIDKGLERKKPSKSFGFPFDVDKFKIEDTAPKGKLLSIKKIK